MVLHLRQRQRQRIFFGAPKFVGQRLLGEKVVVGPRLFSNYGKKDNGDCSQVYIARLLLCQGNPRDWFFAVR